MCCLASILVCLHLSSRAETVLKIKVELVNLMHARHAIFGSCRAESLIGVVKTIFWHSLIIRDIVCRSIIVGVCTASHHRWFYNTLSVSGYEITVVLNCTTITPLSHLVNEGRAIHQYTLFTPFHYTITTSGAYKWRISVNHHRALFTPSDIHES